MTSLIHNYSHLAGKTVYWDTSDNQAHFENNLRDPQKKQILECNGFIDRAISYQFNSHGFRTKEFDQDTDVVCFGCSFTMGTGVAQDDPWPAQLESISGMRVVNLGHAGSSNDTAFRFARYYLQLLKPRYAVWLQTTPHRLELIDDHIPKSQNFVATDSLSVVNDYFLKTWFSSHSNHTLNLEKNTMAFQYLCYQLDIQSLILPQGKMPNDMMARDLQHPGPKIHNALSLYVYDLIINGHKVQSLNQ